MSRSVTIGSGFTNVQLPNGFPYDAGATVVLTDEQWGQINSADVGPSGKPVIDNGAVDENDLVSVQGSHVAQPAALTSSAPAALTSTNAAADPPTQAEFNALRADVVTLRTELGQVQADNAALRTTVSNLLTAITGTGKPMHT